jgi:hypothetical protein
VLINGTIVIINAVTNRFFICISVSAKSLIPLYRRFPFLLRPATLFGLFAIKITYLSAEIHARFSIFRTDTVVTLTQFFAITAMLKTIERGD